MTEPALWKRCDKESLGKKACQILGTTVADVDSRSYLSTGNVEYHGMLMTRHSRLVGVDSVLWAQVERVDGVEQDIFAMMRGSIGRLRLPLRRTSHVEGAAFAQILIVAVLFSPSLFFTKLFFLYFLFL